MHKGVVHSEGPWGMDESQRLGEIYMFAHDNEPKLLLPFKNGTLGKAYDYLQGTVVDLAVEKGDPDERAIINSDGTVSVNGPSSTNEGIANYIAWRNGGGDSISISVISITSGVKVTGLNYKP